MTGEKSKPETAIDRARKTAIRSATGAEAAAASASEAAEASASASEAAASASEAAEAAATAAAEAEAAVDDYCVSANVISAQHGYTLRNVLKTGPLEQF